MPTKKFRIPLKTIRIDKEGCHLSVNAKINGVRLHLIVDTGASQSAFDLKRMETVLGHNRFHRSASLSTGLGTRSMESHMAKIPEMEMGPIIIRNFRVVLLDLSHVNASYIQMNMNTIDGVLGGDLLKKFRAVIDYGARELVLHAGKDLEPLPKTRK